MLNANSRSALKFSFSFGFRDKFCYSTWGKSEYTACGHYLWYLLSWPLPLDPASITTITGTKHAVLMSDRLKVIESSQWFKQRKFNIKNY